MARLLQLDASAAVEGSTSRSLTAAFAAAFAAVPGNAVVRRDLHAEPVPHLPHPQLHWAAPLRSGSAPAAAGEALQEALIAELLAADVLVVGYPLYNYSLPSSLKAWIDHVHVPGRTAPSAGSPLAGRPAVLVATRGGDYGPGAPNEGRDLATPVLELVLGEEMGMDVSVVACQWTLAGNGPDREERVRRGGLERAAALAAVRELGSRLR
ncbi:FMN-dependent NADH-azoreductase [Glycomyces algeriensis]|uniref:FMN dependent NADH:quinone oxidoreductase n=1 Tax=Glycomyces algeriensis TaxID=256037 RepID=A0A9W6LJU5_9ACTN|nr:NAD(P)H-dependent oxidoreductase [Glycomyces algeriensis]MDA1369017.1 NAD(P)H-dependent oxidoreductase [Glycomyces algeriensis]MDR7352326.1 FMN-dependent NADH-azoreductase [Glycomyces algeriensis]GLI45061.1 FMN-dependent NADH-azoreductase [Glycomyces algeriensis]